MDENKSYPVINFVYETVTIMLVINTTNNYSMQLYSRRGYSLCQIVGIFFSVTRAFILLHIFNKELSLGSPNSSMYIMLMEHYMHLASTSQRREIISVRYIVTKRFN